MWFAVPPERAIRNLEAVQVPTGAECSVSAGGDIRRTWVSRLHRLERRVADSFAFSISDRRIEYCDRDHAPPIADKRSNISH